MSGRSARSAWLGSLLGVWVAVSIVLLEWFNEGKDQAFLEATNFIANLPMVLFIEKLGIPGIFEVEILILYCALVGAVLGLLKGKDRPLPWVFFGVILVILVAGHWYALLAPSTGPISW